MNSEIRRVCNFSEDGEHHFTTNSNCDDCGRGAVVVNGEILYVPTDKGVIYHQSNHPKVLFYGGRGSGKSMCGRWDAHMRALAHPGFKYCILRRTFPELYKSHLIELPSEMKKLGGKFVNKQARYPNGSIGFFSHCQNETDALNLLSAEFHLMFFDEISTFEWEMVQKLAASIRTLKGSNIKGMLRAATNPLGMSAEMINRYWIMKDITPDEDVKYKPEDWVSIKANAIDNPYLEVDEYMTQLSGLSAHMQKAWIDGDFSIENALFDFRPMKNGKPYHVIQELDIEKVAKNAVIYRAIDAGWYPDPTVCLWIAHLGNRHIVFNEKIWWKTTAEKIAADIKAEDARLKIGRVAMTYCDPSMDINTTADVRTIRDIYEMNGIPMEPSINNREMYATFMHNMLKEESYEDTPRIQFLHDPYNKNIGCPYLARTIPQMRYDIKHPKAMDDHKDDHAVVACCYYLISHAADPRNEMQTPSKLPRWMRPKNNTSPYVLGRENVRDR